MDKPYYRKRLTICLILFFACLPLTSAQAAKLPKNQKPVANAGADQLAGLSQTVSLSASQSYDPDPSGAVIAYQWSKVSGPKVKIADPKSPTTTFTTPATLKKTKPVNLVFKLTVTDNRKSKAKDTVVIHVSKTPCAPPQQLQNGSCVSPQALIKLNDTGVTLCSDDSNDNQICPVAGFPGQDAQFGRDFTHNDDSDGHAGFSFSKLDNNGNTLQSSANEWDCVKDNVTGLIWEIKTTSGLRHMDNTYSWYEPDNSKNGDDPGTQNGGSCSGSSCDTYNYVQAINIQGLCGANDWRMPSISELMSIVNNDRYLPTIDTTYFPNTPNSFVWSSSPNAAHPSFAWGVGFDYGGVLTSTRTSFYVRLVRGGQ